MTTLFTDSGRIMRRRFFARLGLLLIAATPAPAQPPREDASVQSARLDSLLPSWLVTAIHATNPDILAQRAMLAAAEARLSASGLAPAAILSAELDDAPSGRFGQSSVRVGIERELSRSRRQASRSVAETEWRAAQAALLLTEQRASAAALRALAQAAGWRAIEVRQAAQDSLLESAEASLRARFAIGDARYVDVLRLRTERLRVQSERAGALVEARAGVLALVALAGGVRGAPRDTTPSFDAAHVDSLVRLTDAPLLRGAMPPPPDVDSLLAVSGLVALADAAIGQAAAQRQLLAATQRPQVSAGIGLQRLSAQGGGSLGPTAGISMFLPFTARRANTSALRAADRGVEAAEAGRRATRATLRSALAIQHDRYEAARARVALFNAALLRGAEEERESALAAYRTGNVSLLELLDFERALSNVAIERTRAIVDATDALADLFAGATAAAGFLRADLPTTSGVPNER